MGNRVDPVMKTRRIDGSDDVVQHLCKSHRSLRRFYGHLGTLSTSVLMLGSS